ncbi:hypothetical protein TNCV_1141661 [Trichonephila clavipes]|nr:hypothetical protein TNCV_1141661 [Trichonephila clavipes]
MSLPGNEAADELPGRDCNLPNPSSSVLSHSDIHSIHRAKMNLTRALQTALVRFRSGHSQVMTFVQGVKSFFTCTSSLIALPTHLLDCWCIFLGQLFGNQDLVSDIILQKGQMDLVKAFLLQRDLKQQQQQSQVQQLIFIFE